ncbi:probable methyltransferase-like protein 24 [Dreissena polymorpha]|uniref:Methyltransferase domain-containing protein n=1 Tax=Dreissena polymorpha TaxID=45954 RepID=A0A9D3Z4H3_DREPO|nr:probable methyltransferase-like protein 24 [Dreissena polymorpha]KAH3710621.1 hypothetical protein DPMN_070110 [Dreissena polymorpha]
MRTFKHLTNASITRIRKMNLTRKHKIICATILFGLIMCILVTIYKEKRSYQVPEMSAEESENVNVFEDDVVTYEAGDYVLPDDATLKQMTRVQLLGVFWKYINRIQTLCRNVYRVGTVKDGGKEICTDKPYRPSPPCIVYSFGIDYRLEFDLAVVKLFGCQVYAFDPSMKMESKRVSEHIWFYNWGLGGEDTVTNNGWVIKTLATIRKELGHSNKTIDVLKVDVEGDEWHALLQMLKTGALKDVKQIAMETHFLDKGNFPEEGNAQLSALRDLYNAGFRIFMRDRNIVGSKNLKGDWSMTDLNEISLINTRIVKTKQ